MLTTIGVDGNDQVVPIAFALVESEKSESWLWFLKLLKRALVEERENVCVMHDRNACLLNAVDKLKNGREPEVQWHDIQSRWCMRHLASNFYKQFRSKRLMDLFKRQCKQNHKKLDWSPRYFCDDLPISSCILYVTCSM